jgi:hypothetical protein
MKDKFDGGPTAARKPCSGLRTFDILRVMMSFREPVNQHIKRHQQVATGETPALEILVDNDGPLRFQS